MYSPRLLLPVAIVSALTWLPAALLHADSGTWIQQPGGADTSASGSWNTPGNWNPTTADGSAFTADFNTLDISGITTSSNVITLDAPRTIGSIIFGNTNTATAGSWNIEPGTGTPSLTMAGAATITVNALGSSGFARINAVVAGSDGLIKSGAGMLVLSAANTYTGTTQITGGILRLMNANPGASTSYAISSGAALSFEATTIVFSANTSGAGSVTKANSGSTVTLNGNGGHTGGTTLTDGGILMGTGTNNGLGTGTLALNSGRIGSSDNNARTITNTLTMGSGGLTFGAGQGAVTGLGDLNFTSTGSVAIGGTKNWAVNNSTTVTFAGNWSGNTGHTITKTGTGTLVFNGNIATANTVGVSVSAGVMILNGTGNTYAGTTTVGGGTLQINGTKSGGGAVNVNSGTLTGTGSIAGLTSLASGARIQGKSGGTLTFTGGLTLNASGGGILDYELGTHSAANLLNISGGTFTSNTSGLTQITITETTGFGQGNYALINWATGAGVELGDFQLVNSVYSGGRSGYLQITGNTLELVVVPEPGLGALLATGFGMLIVTRRRRAH